MTNDHSTFLVLLVGNVLWSLSAKAMVMQLQLPMHGPSQNVGGGHLKAHQTAENNLKGRAHCLYLEISQSFLTS